MIAPRRLFLPLLIALACPAGTILADEPDALKAALGREIIGPRQAMAEVQDFCEARIPRRPDAATAEEWTNVANRLRDDALDKVVFRGEARRWRDAETKVEWQDTIEGGPGYRIRKLRYEALPGLWIPALLYEPEKLDGKVPVVLNVNGHDGQGKAADYKQIRCINQAKRGMLALNVEWFGMGQLKGAGFAHGLINALDLCGTSGVAVHYLYLRRGLDVLLAHEHADPARAAVTGLSGGGWQTSFFSPLDTRVTLMDPVAGYSSFVTRVRHLSDLGDSEQTPCDLATVVDYATLTAMMAPRPTLLTFNAKDNCCFAAPHALPPLLDAARPVFALFGKEDNLRSHINDDPGDHNYGLDNRLALYKMLGDHFFAGNSSYETKELPTDGEIRTADELKVELPAGNADFHSLALELSRSLPRGPEMPTGRDAARRWQEEQRLRLQSLVRPPTYEPLTEKVDESKADGVTITRWKLRLGSAWTVPAVELARGEPSGTALLIADGGRDSDAAVAAVREQLDAGRRVVAIDPFYFGEAKVKERDYLFALLVGAVGERPLGVQAGQVMSVARWLHAGPKGRPTVVAVGPRASLIALAAAALEPSSIGGVELHRPPGSLKEVIEGSKSFDSAPEIFCFGLLERFDVPQIAALVAPRPVRVRDPGERARKELAGLSAWYEALGEKYDPLP